MISYDCREEAGATYEQIRQQIRQENTAIGHVDSQVRLSSQRVISSAMQFAHGKIKKTSQGKSSENHGGTHWNRSGNSLSHLYGKN